MFYLFKESLKKVIRLKAVKEVGKPFWKSRTEHHSIQGKNKKPEKKNDNVIKKPVDMPKDGTPVT